MSDEPGYRDAETLSRLYHEENLSVREIGDRFDVRHSTILTWMDRHDIDRRTRGEARRMQNASKLYVGIMERGHGNPKYRVEFREFGEHRAILLSKIVALLDNPTEKVFSDEYHVHHKNRCPLDDRPCNLEVLTEEEHRDEHREDAAEWATMSSGSF